MGQDMALALKHAAADLASGDPTRPATASSFCALGHLTAVFLEALGKWQEGAQATWEDAAAYLEASVFLTNPASFWWLLDGSSWPIRAGAILEFIERTERALKPSLYSLVYPPWYPCADSGTDLPAQEQEPARGTDAFQGDVRVAVMANHNYIFDVILGLREAAAALQLRLTVVLVGYVLGELYPLGKLNCEVMGYICLLQPRISALTATLSAAPEGLAERHVNLVPDPVSRQPVKDWPDTSPLTVADVRHHLRAAWAETPELQAADLIVCGYPYPACYFLDEVVEAPRQGILLPIHGTVVTEYMSRSLQGLVHGTLLRWMRTKEGAAEGPRHWVFAMNHIEHYWFQQAFGRAVPSERRAFVPLAGRYMHWLTVHAIGESTFEHWRAEKLFPKCFYIDSPGGCQSRMAMPSSASFNTVRRSSLRRQCCRCRCSLAATKSGSC
eukprot:TRINITY_DN12144_c0_g1_i7.p1 TRINITY_DN12144_c0_g1~~TRINITY_DN12144_c0_g1_i7.p1  ORF type:complete len:442 (-),score=65.90 TRINITY_DN12144_c0_g1_i7:505-1830(-)